jgi:hypothetical protein
MKKPTSGEKALDEIAQIAANKIHSILIESRPEIVFNAIAEASYEVLGCDFVEGGESAYAEIMQEVCGRIIVTTI